MDAGRRLGAAEQGETPGRSQGDNSGSGSAWLLHHVDAGSGRRGDVQQLNRSHVIKFAIEAGLIIVKDGTIMLDPAWLKYLRGYAAANQEDWSLFA